MNNDPEKEIVMKLSAVLPPLASSVEPIHCIDCGSKNPAHRKFCGKCGGHLWDPCLECGLTNPAHEEFCGNCGVSLADGLRRKTAHVEETISQAAKCVEEYRFPDAIGLLAPLEAIAHPRLLSTVNRAKELLRHISCERIRWSSLVREIEAEVERCDSPDKLDAALRRIREIPDAIRSPELRVFLENGQRQQAEIAELSDSIARSNEGPLTAELVKKIERLLSLQPEHAKAAKLGLAINRRVMRKAKDMALQGKHQKAVDALDRVPAAFQDREFRALRDQLADMAFLAWDVGHAPLVDNALFDFARRLGRFLPEDSELKNLCRKLANIEPKFRQSAVASRHWAKHPDSPLLGAPLDFLADLSLIRVEHAERTAVLAENPGRFAVACGLALQGLGFASLDIDLLPEKTRIGKIGSWFSQRKPQSAWGIEISASGIKGVKLHMDAESNREAHDRQPTVVLQESRIVEHRRHLTQSANEKDRDSLLEETLKKFLEQNHLADTPVVVSLPDWMVLLKTVEFPPLPAHKREQAIAHESWRLFPSPMPEVAWKHVRFDAGNGGETKESPFTVAFIGVRQRLLKEFLKHWAKAGLKISAVQCDMAALYNFAMFQAGPDRSTEPIAVVDLGADRLNVLVCSARRIWHRSVMFGADRINKALVREFQLTYSQAEQWKRNPALAPSPGKCHEALQPTYEVYLEEIRDSLDAYRKAFPNDRISRVIACGGGLAAHDLPRYLLWKK